VQDDTLKTVANGGHVKNANGYDIMFFADEAQTIRLKWDVEIYDGDTGTLIAWVKIPTLSHSSDTIFYMQYGNATISSFQGGATGSAYDSYYVGIYHFPNGYALSAADATAHGHYGIITDASATFGIIDGAASFDGVTATIQINGKLFHGLTQGTYEMWVCPTSFPAEAIICYEDGGGHNGFNVEFAGATSPLKLNLGSNTFIESATSTWDADTWYHIVITFDGANVIFYINGALDINHANSSLPGTTVNNTQLGCSYDGVYDNFYAGYLDEVRISNKVRSASWILTQYNNQSNPGSIAAPGFIAYGPEV
jgi:biopolymer transport protein ExbB